MRSRSLVVRSMWFGLVFLLPVGLAQGQDPKVNVAISDQAPEPAWIEEEVTATLTASVENPPADLTGPTWITP